MTRPPLLTAAAALLITAAGQVTAQENPEYWRINVHNTLNVRAEPSTYAPAIAQLQRGMVVRNLGCGEDMGRMWCRVPIAPEDGASAGWVAMDFLVPASGPGMTVDHGANPEPTTQTMRVQFASGMSGAQERGRLSPGSSIRYVLGAGNGQTLEVSFNNADSGLEYRIVMPNGHLLLDPVATTLPYQGQLYMGGDHVVEVINRSHHWASYSAWLGIY